VSNPEEAARVESLGNGRYAIDRAGARSLAYAAATATGTWVFFEGRSYFVPRASGRRTRPISAHDDPTALAAPMPATVVAVNVAPGQQVKRGDVLVRLEAMKMELPITAPRDATVKSVACRAGELVQPGVPLLALE
jgi:biotin carboxyl carrier protein